MKKLKFKVGDIVEATSEGIYMIACRSNEWVGQVTGVEKGWFTAKTIRSLMAAQYEGVIIPYLDYRYFKKIEDGAATIKTHLIRGNKTIIKLSNGKVGIAECNPEDKFDEAVGAAIAILRAYGKTVADLTVCGYKEVRRKAKVGEYIKITNPIFCFDKPGDIFKVSSLPGGVHWKDYPKDRKVSMPLDCEEFWYHLEREYVVLEGYKPIEKKEK